MNKQNLLIVSHWGVDLLNNAINSIKKIDENSEIGEIINEKSVLIKHSIEKSVLDVLFEQFTKDKLDFSTIEPKIKKLLIADMDSTIISCECLDELADFADKKDQVSEITERAMNGELNFEEALTQRVRMLKGLSIEAMGECFEQRVALNKGAKEMIDGLKSNGAYTALVSGGFKFFTKKVKEWIGFDEDNSNEFIYENNSLSGEVVLPILGKEAKLQRLMQLCNEKSIDPIDAIAIGDGANDLMMIEKAGLGIAYMAKPIVAAKAPARINSGNLESVLIFSGIN